MSILDRFLKSKLEATANVVDEQAVLIYIANEDLEASIPLQEKLEGLLTKSDIGMFDGNKVGGGELVLYLYGADAELLFEHIESTLRADQFCKGARVVIRRGGPSAPQREVVVGP